MSHCLQEIAWLDTENRVAIPIITAGRLLFFNIARLPVRSSIFSFKRSLPNAYPVFVLAGISAQRLNWS
jgi:hypothetical protein